MWRKIPCCEWTLYSLTVSVSAPGSACGKLILKAASALGLSYSEPSWSHVLIIFVNWNYFQITPSHLFSCKGRGGQSALRFARLRMEKRHNYVRKVAETAVQLFISGDKVNVAGLVLAGSADFKTELSQSDMFDQVSGLFWAKPKCLSLSVVTVILAVATWYEMHLMRNITSVS